MVAELYRPFFVCDLLHYAGGAITLRLYLEREEQKHWDATHTELTDVQKPRWVDCTATTFALAKPIVLLIAFGCLITEFEYRLARTPKSAAASAQAAHISSDPTEPTR